MAKLPFVVAPKLNSRVETLGSDESGKLEIERKGFLTVGEKAFMANVSNQDQVLRLVMKLSRSVAKSYKLSQQDAYQAVVDAATNPDTCKLPILDDYADEIADLVSKMLAEEQRKQFMMAYCMLLYRIDDTLEMSDVVELHEDLIGDLVQLFLDEESKSVERLLSDNENPEEVGSAEVNEIEKK